MRPIMSPDVLFMFDPVSDLHCRKTLQAIFLFSSRLTETLIK